MSSHSKIETSDSSRAAKTRWSLLAGVREGTEDEKQRVVGELCERYWIPVYFFVRQSGQTQPATAALTQAFLGKIVERLRSRAEPMPDGFRQYMQNQLVAFLTDSPTADAAAHAHPQPPAPLDEIERRFQEGFRAEATPEQAMQRGFAFALLARSLSRLRREAEQAGRGELFQSVRPWLSREPGEDDYKALATQAGSSPLAMVIAVKRLRQRFQEIVDEELSLSVGESAEVNNERQTMLSMVVPDPSGE